MKRFRTFWLSLSIDRKVKLFAVLILAAVGAAVIFNISILNYGFVGLGQSLSDISRAQTAQAAMESERAALVTYMREQSDSTKQALQNAQTHTRSSIDLLPDDITRIGDERYAKLWNIRNAYQYYEKERDQVTATDPNADGAIARLYRVYQEIDYLEGYLRTYTQLSVTQGSRDYQQRAAMVQSFPYLLGLFIFAVFLGLASFWRIISNTLVTPILNLAKEVRQIGAGDFSGEDLKVMNRDEVGELVDAVNGMKHATAQNIRTLQENQKLSDRLHKEEMNRMEMEKVLETTRLDLLQSQINPHFLFNTLNMIGSMAVLEDAETTEKMIRSLSNIFRYNLHTNAQFIALSQELQEVRDYMYLQQMRFGDRLHYVEDVGGVDPDQIMIPVFLLQPLAENAVVHGVTKKEAGGTVTLRVRMESGNVCIVIEDTGIGMSPESYQSLMEDLHNGRRRKVDEAGRTGHAGIGMGNVYQRIHSIYRDGHMTVETKEGEGTRIRLVLPQDEKIVPIEENQFAK